MSFDAAVPVKMFWQPGCSSCLRTKEFLKKNGVPFESIDVANDPSGLEQLRALGARSVPIVSRGDAYTLCQSMADVVKFLGLDTKLEPALPPAELYAKLDNVLSAAIRLTFQFPQELLSTPFRDRKRTLGNTAFHVFRVAEMGLQTGQGQPLQPEGFSEVAPPDWGAEEIAAWGAEVRESLSKWWVDADTTLKYTVRTYYGFKTMHEVFERTTWHAAQHTRQLALMLQTYGIEPADPLSPEDLKGLPVPDDVWG